MTIEEMREYYVTHSMEFDGVAEYGWMDTMPILDPTIDTGPRCRVCRDSILTIVDVGAICRECRLTGGYNSGRYVK